MVRAFFTDGQPKSRQKDILGPNFPPMTILPPSLTYKDIIENNVDVQEYLAYIKEHAKCPLNHNTSFCYDHG